MFLKISDVPGNCGDVINVSRVQAAQVVARGLEVFLAGSTKPLSVEFETHRRARWFYERLLERVQAHDDTVLEFAGVSFVRPTEIVSLNVTTVPGVLDDKENTPCVWPALVFNLNGDKSLVVEERSFSGFNDEATLFIPQLLRR